MAGVRCFPRTLLSCACLTGSLCFSHRYRQWKGKCTFASEDGTVWQRCFTVVPSHMTQAFHYPDGKGFYKVKLMCVFSNVAFATQIWTQCTECIVVAVQTPL